MKAESVRFNLKDFKCFRFLFELNFLDLNIEKIKFEYNIYRKPSFTDTTLHASSVHGIKYKYTASQSMVNRALKIQTIKIAQPPY